MTINGHLLSPAETDAKLSCIIALDILNTKSPICTCATWVEKQSVPFVM